MDTQVRKLDYDNIDPEIMKEAGDIIRPAAWWPFPPRLSMAWAETP